MKTSVSVRMILLAWVRMMFTSSCEIDLSWGNNLRYETERVESRNEYDKKMEKTHDYDCREHPIRELIHNLLGLIE